MMISPKFIPHTDFHKGIWLLPINGSSWYYFSECENRNLITNENFLESVDEPLKELVSFLHEKKIRTTPSCAGHNYEKEYFEKIYSDLKKDEKVIRNEGLLLKDIETGATHLFKDNQYQLPWERNYFVDFAQGYQTQGIIGLRLDPQKAINEKVLQLKIPGITIMMKDQITFIYTERGSSDKWQNITASIKDIFKQYEMK